MAAVWTRSCAEQAAAGSPHRALFQELEKAGFETCSAEICSLPAAGEALSVRAPTRLCCAAEPAALASTGRPPDAFATAGFGSGRARGAGRFSGSERRDKTQRGDCKAW